MTAPDPTRPTRVMMTVAMIVEHVSGPVVADEHVGAWLADGVLFGGGDSAPTFEVCPRCPLPETCGCDPGGLGAAPERFSLYRAAPVAVQTVERLP